MYCPRRFALLEVNDDWAENAFVVKQTSSMRTSTAASATLKISVRSSESDLSVYNDDPKYNIFGVVDCIEFVRDKCGDYIDTLDGTFRVEIVEYKPTRPKAGEFNQTDAIQVYAQKLCVDNVFHCNSRCFLYYADVRRRSELPFDTQGAEYDKMLCDYLGKMREILAADIIPKRVKGQKCSGCSLSDMCFPKVKKYSVKNTIFSMNGGENNA